MCLIVGKQRRLGLWPGAHHAGHQTVCPGCGFFQQWKRQPSIRGLNHQVTWAYPYLVNTLLPAPWGAERDKRGDRRS